MPSSAQMRVRAARDALFPAGVGSSKLSASHGLGRQIFSCLEEIGFDGC
jgi:hypothetical protein